MPQPSNEHDFAPSASLTALERRSALLLKLREFFYERHFIEVETPLLARDIIPELHIEPIQAENGAFLQASPELHMKRMLAAGPTAIFQVTRSFRAGERGQLHNPEFTIVEWYRIGDDMRAGIELLDELTESLLRAPPCTRTTYAAAFQRTLGLCPHTASIDDLSAAAASLAVNWGRAPASPESMSRDEWLNLLLATHVEPQLGKNGPEIIFHYPATQASLAKIASTEHGYDVAERFELYYRGIELANGFHELTDAAEQRRRFEAVNAVRISEGRRALPMPESLLATLEHGLPECSGAALGFDRLLMLAVAAQSIDEVIAFPGAEA
jgi:elongation factor P--(R)-beta-lysine ligase